MLTFVLCAALYGILGWIKSSPLPQALTAEDEAPSQPHAAGSFQKAGGALTGTQEHEQPQPPEDHVRHPGSSDEEQLAASRVK